MKKSDYAVIDKLYSCYDEYRFIFKHIFVPNAKYGKNSSHEIRYGNGPKLPNRWTTMFDHTKGEIGISKQEI